VRGPCTRVGVSGVLKLGFLVDEGMDVLLRPQTQSRRGENTNNPIP